MPEAIDGNNHRVTHPVKPLLPKSGEILKLEKHVSGSGQGLIDTISPGRHGRRRQMASEHVTKKGRISTQTIALCLQAILSGK